MDDAELGDAVREALRAMLRDAPDPEAVLAQAERELLAMLTTQEMLLDEAQKRAILLTVREAVSDARTSLRMFPPEECS